ncbi:MAG: HAMP domain-containing sensor histidine kinase [Acidimicrobiia bacterium]
MTGELPTLRFRLAVRAFAYTLLTLIVLGGVAWVATHRVIAERVETDAEDFLLTLTGELEISSSPSDPNVTIPVTQPGRDRVAQIIRLDDGEVMVATSGVTTQGLLEPSAFRGDEVISEEVPHPTEEDARLFISATSVTSQGTEYGVIAGVYTTSILGYTGMTIALLGVALVIASGLGLGVWFSVRSALGPVESLAYEADRVASTADPETWILENLANTAEIDQLIERLNSLLTRVHEGQERERAFLEDASHDLRTPIAVARAELDLAKSSTSEEDTRMALASAIEELDRLDRLAADLLILARMRAAPTRAMEQVHLGHMVRKAAARMMRNPDRREVELTVEGNADVRGDPRTLERAIDNLLSNAIRHASRSVEIDIANSDAEAVIRVCDDGPGFPASLLSSAVKRFTSTAARSEGTGLGLAIAAAIAEAHDGSLEVSNQTDGGAAVALHIPTGVASRKSDHALR